MEIARKSQYSGEWNVMELDITQEQLMPMKMARAAFRIFFPIFRQMNGSF